MEDIDGHGDIHMEGVGDALPPSTEQKGDWDQSLPDPSSVPTQTWDIGENELVLFKAQDHTDKWKWYVGMVIELPKEGEVYFSVQPYGSNKLTKTKKRSIAESQFIPIWMDERDDKEVWATRAPKECATYLMQVEPEEIILTGFEMTDWYMPEAVLEWLERKGRPKVRKTPIRAHTRRGKKK